MQNKPEEDLLDYNELEEENEKGSGQHASHTPPHSPTDLTSEENGGEEGDTDRSNLEEGQDIEMDTSSTQQALIEWRQREFDNLTSMLNENGWKMRVKVWSDKEQTYRTTPMTALTTIVSH